MNRNSNISKEMSTRATGRRPAPRWRTVFIALVLALTFGSVRQTAPAQAQFDEDDVNYQFLVDVDHPLDNPLCVGESREYRVRILEKGTIGPKEPIVNASITLAGKTNITGVVENSNVADFTSARTVLINSPSARGLRPAAVTFMVKGKTKGNATLSFSADVEYYGHMVKALPFTDIRVEVINCKFKVKTKSESKVPGEAHIKVEAISGEAEVKAAQAGGPLTGSTTVNLFLSMSSVLDCHGTSASGSSNVELSGNLDDNGQLTLDVTYQTANITVPVYCVGSDGGTIDTTQSFPLTPDPVHISVASSGGVLNQSHVIQGPEAMPGKVTIIVIPEEDEAAAFNPGVHQASWDDFSNLLGALLALE